LLTCGSPSKAAAMAKSATVSTRVMVSLPVVVLGFHISSFAEQAEWAPAAGRASFLPMRYSDPAARVVAGRVSPSMEGDEPKRPGLTVPRQSLCFELPRSAGERSDRNDAPPRWQTGPDRRGRRHPRHYSHWGTCCPRSRSHRAVGDRGWRTRCDCTHGLGRCNVDINLRGKAAFPVADVLADRHIPFVFATGYLVAGYIPARHANVRRFEKPIPPSIICRALEEAMHEATWAAEVGAALAKISVRLRQPRLPVPRFDGSNWPCFRRQGMLPVCSAAGWGQLRTLHATVVVGTRPAPRNPVSRANRRSFGPTPAFQRIFSVGPGLDGGACFHSSAAANRSIRTAAFAARHLALSAPQWWKGPVAAGPFSVPLNLALPSFRRGSLLWWGRTSRRRRAWLSRPLMINPPVISDCNAH